MQPSLSPYCNAIEQFQNTLKKEGWAAFWLPHNDVHQNEYLPEAAKWRDRLINFTGSAGDALVLQNTVWLYADGRYHVQAEQDVPTTHVQVSKLGLEGQPTLMETLETLPRGSVVAYDASTLTAKQIHEAEDRLKPLYITLVPVEYHPLTEIIPYSEPEKHPKPWRTVEANVHGRSTTDN
jgi:Xaa-Pro aminopeptidase